MQSTGQTSTQPASLTAMHGSAMIKTAIDVRLLQKIAFETGRAYLIIIQNVCQPFHKRPFGRAGANVHSNACESYRMMLYLRCLAGKKGRRKQTRSRVPSLRLLIVDDHPLVRKALC